MCGIAGILAYSQAGKALLPKIGQAVMSLEQRGPDAQSSLTIGSCALGHSRLSVIDPRPEGTQPLQDYTGRYAIVFNGEFYGYREQREKLMLKGYRFKTLTDTEVVLNMYIDMGIAFLDELNGCYAFAIHDTLTGKTIAARDRFGIKPLVYWASPDFFIFASEIKAIAAIKCPQQIDKQALSLYFQLNYIPQPYTIYSEIKKLLPGHYIELHQGKYQLKQYFSAATEPEQFTGTYKQACSALLTEIDAAVERRLVSDVPLGCFLSGGIDSSAIASLAASKIQGLRTFSVGFTDNPYFDETKYANAVARKIGSNHTVFPLSSADLLENLFDMLDYFDEPFADSSALPVHILSLRTRKHVTVALSGDGADELFAGYNKHAAFKAAQASVIISGAAWLAKPLLAMIPQSRNGRLGNIARQASKFAEISSMEPAELYWRLCSIWNKADCRSIMGQNMQQHEQLYSYQKPHSLRQSLVNDLQMVLPGDMLFKVDSMSMSKGLEVRVPFLDKNVFRFSFSIPDSYKLKGGFKKRILQDCFREILPPELYKRPKQGFEVPLLGWFRAELSSIISEYLSQEMIEAHGLISYSQVENLRKQMLSSSPADSASKIWAVLCFQYWWHNKHSANIKDAINSNF
jgi:asparagine synthase (glutamine-hydrolysing)